MVGNALSNYKTLVSGQSLSVNVKYEPNRVIECHGVFLQLMNDDRTLLVRITGKNHRKATDKAIYTDFFNEIIS